ncbi:hypothetical protein OS493_011312 [Desmophyllum pertusum]|uniref:Class II aldolase/adducin N-terminal domain-containing protein n=1 Tax=Desmophyllum pertusum TaxID=174260 RepID=A0A9W9Z4P0_9CNID|nr:hypothetical protein OS493_011312 [Desmophyllum pertusum]
MAGLGSTSIEHSEYSKDPEHPINLIPELCRQFYHLDWVTAPEEESASSVEMRSLLHPLGFRRKEIKVSSNPMTCLCVTLTKNELYSPPPEKKTHEKSVYSIVYECFQNERSRSCNSHALQALRHGHPAVPGKEFRITHQEMIKGLKKDSTGVYYRYNEELVIPIIENTPEERDLKESMARAMVQYPDSCAVLVRRHGVYIWGETWQKAKTMCECLDYLCDIATQMKLQGLDPAAKPKENINNGN